MTIPVIVSAATLAAVSVLVAVLRAKLNALAAERGASKSPYLTNVNRGRTE